jgi:DNA-binding YbaB/EbfC family protein
MARPGGKRPGGGFPGGPGGPGGGFDPMKMIEGATASAKKAAEELEKELAQKTCEGAAGGGMVSAVVTGTLDLRSIKIDPSVIDKNEKDMLEDLVVAAVNAAVKKAKEVQAQAQQELQQKQIQQMFGGMGGLGDLGKMLGM